MTLPEQPGVGADCLAFFNEMDIVAVGADNAALEWGFGNPQYVRKAFKGYATGPLHPDFLWNRGAYIIEILNLFFNKLLFLHLSISLH